MTERLDSSDRLTKIMLVSLIFVSFSLFLPVANLAAQEIAPILHLITLSDNSNRRKNADEDVSEADCFNRDIASLTLAFICNVPPDQLRIYHFTNDHQPSSKAGKNSFYEENENFNKGEWCGENCKIQGNYLAPGYDRIVHLCQKPRLFWSGNIGNTLPKIIYQQVQSQDIVVFYYSGHANWVNNDIRYRHGRQGISKNKILRILGIDKDHRSKRPKKIIALSDCCSILRKSDVKSEPLESVAPEPWICMPPDRISPGFESLFFSEGNDVDICASQKGMPAISLTQWPQYMLVEDEPHLAECDYGGIFTMCLAATLVEKCNSTDLTWHGFFQEVDKKSDRLFQAAFPGGMKMNKPVLRGKDNDEVMERHSPYSFRELDGEPARFHSDILIFQ